MAKFKAGDRVVCENPGSWTMLKVGTIYTVHEVWNRGSREECIKLAELMASHPGHLRYASAFRLADPEPAAFDLLAAMTGKPLKFRSGCEVKFVAYVPDAKPHCQLVLLNPATGNVVTRYANGKSSEEPYSEPGDILNAGAA